MPVRKTPKVFRRRFVKKQSKKGNRPICRERGFQLSRRAMAGAGVREAWIVDFKTDRIEGTPDQVAATLRTRHAGQLAGYRDAVAAIYELPPARVRASVVGIDAGVVADLAD